MIATSILIALANAQASYYSVDGGIIIKVSGTPPLFSEARWTFAKPDRKISTWQLFTYKTADQAVMALESKRKLEESLNRYFGTSSSEWRTYVAPVLLPPNTFEDKLGPVGATIVRERFRNAKSAYWGHVLEHLPYLGFAAKTYKRASIAYRIGIAIVYPERWREGAQALYEAVESELPLIVRASKDSHDAVSRITSDAAGLAELSLRYLDRALTAENSVAVKLSPILQDFQHMFEKTYGPRVGFSSPSNGFEVWRPVSNGLESWSSNPHAEGLSLHSCSFGFAQVRNVSSYKIRARYKVVENAVTVVEEGIIEIEPKQKSPIMWFRSGGRLDITLIERV